MAKDENKKAKVEGKKTRKPITLWKKYESKSGSVARKSKFCPKCGTGFFLSAHKNRLYCGKCKYTEFVKA